MKIIEVIENMNILTKIEKAVEESGFFESGYLDIGSLRYNNEVRKICQENMCRNYATSWACPPAIGTLTECKERVDSYDKMLLLSKKYDLEDSFDFEGMIKALKDFKLTVDVFQQKIEIFLSDYMLLSNEGCGRRSECTYPNAPETMKKSL